MWKPISTRTHGLLDLAGAAAMLALPRALGWSDRATKLMTGSAIGMLGLSLMTRYEFGAFKVVPMRDHLIADGLLGGLLCASTFWLEDEDPTVQAVLLALGGSEIAGALLTEPYSPEEVPSLPVTAHQGVARLQQGLARSGGFHAS